MNPPVQFGFQGPPGLSTLGGADLPASPGTIGQILVRASGVGPAGLPATQWTDAINGIPLLATSVPASGGIVNLSTGDSKCDQLVITAGTGTNTNVNFVSASRSDSVPLTIVNNSSARITITTAGGSPFNVPPLWRVPCVWSGGDILPLASLPTAIDVETVNVTAGDVALTATQAAGDVIRVTGTPGVARNVTVPDTSLLADGHEWTIVNDANRAIYFACGGYSTTIASGTAATVSYDASVGGGGIASGCYQLADIGIPGLLLVSGNANQVLRGDNTFGAVPSAAVLGMNGHALSNVSTDVVHGDGTFGPLTTNSVALTAGGGTVNLTSTQSAAEQFIISGSTSTTFNFTSAARSNGVVLVIANNGGTTQTITTNGLAGFVITSGSQQVCQWWNGNVQPMIAQATAASFGGVKLGGDISGTASAPTVPGAVKEIRIPIGTLTSYSSTATIPSGAYVQDVEVIITTPFSAGATISVGQTGSTSAFMATDGNNPQTAGEYVQFQDTPANASGLAALVTIGGSPAAGAGVVKVHFATPRT